MDFSSMACNTRASSEFSVESPTDAIPSPPKRKGGRKPTFTAEARRQRNRDAQAAFRERRTDYIKELEETVKTYGDKLRKLEAARGTTADECLMLRYKNSLLERILVYKGVDVQAELKSELWNPGLVPVRKQALHDAQSRKTLKRKAQGVKATANIHYTDLPSLTQTAQHLSPISNSPETSGPSTPPPMAPPALKRAKTCLPSHASYVPAPSCKREDPRKVFSSAASTPTNESSPVSQEYKPQKSHPEILPVPQIESLTSFLEAGDNPYSLGSLDDFDFSTDYSALTPMSFPTFSL